MRFYLSLVLKNLLRHKKRSLITAISIAAGIWAYVFMDSMVQGMVYDQTFNLVNFETATLRIMDSDYWPDRSYFPLDKSIEDPIEVLSRLESLNIPMTARIRFSADIVYYQDPFPNDGSKSMQIIAVDPRQDAGVFGISSSLVSGQWLDGNVQSIVLGAGSAERIGAEPGYPLIIQTRTRDGSYQTIDVLVSGIIDTPNPYVDMGEAFISLELADYMLAMDGAVTDISMAYPPGTDQHRAAAEVRQLLPVGLTVKTWDEVEPTTSDFAAIANAETRAFTFFIFIIAMVGISNTMINSVYERFREIGMMRSLGMEDNRVILSLMLEAAGIGLLGGLLGVLLSVPSTWLLVNRGIDFSMFMEDVAMGFRFDPVFRGFWNPGTMVLSVVLGTIVSGLVAWIPARRAIRKSVVDCLRSE